MLRNCLGVRSELDILEFKLAKNNAPEKLWRSLSALANRRGGGSIICGVTKDYSAEGVEDIEKVQSDIVSQATDLFDPPIRVECKPFQYENRNLLAVIVPEYPRSAKPACNKNEGLPKGACVRVGNSTRQMTKEEIKRMWQEQTTDYDSEPAHGTSMSDIDLGEVEKYLHRFREINPGVANHIGSEQFLSNEKCIVVREGKPIPTVAGILFFGKAPEKFFPKACIVFSQYPGTEKASNGQERLRLTDSTEIRGTIPVIAEQANKIVASRMKMSTLVRGIAHERIPEYPFGAIREALHNAIVHRDYHLHGRSIQVRMFTDRLEIESPGNIFEGLRISQIKAGAHSTRNDTIMRLMTGIGLAEERGTGIQIMLRASKDAGTQKPDFFADDARFIVTLHSSTFLRLPDVDWLSRLRQFNLRRSQITALVWAKNQGQITNVQYRELHRGMDSRDAQRELADLVKKGLLVKTGAGRGTGYKVVPFVKGLGFLIESSGPAEVDKAIAVVNVLVRLGRGTNKDFRPAIGEPETPSGSVKTSHFLKRLATFGIISGHGKPPKRYWTLNKKLNSD